METLHWPHEIVQFERVMAAAPQRRQDPVFAAAWLEGEDLPFDEVAGLALAIK